jgi:hypothetical protein
VPTPLAVTHVQPLPGGKILIACARTPGTDNAEVWDGNGHLERAGVIGDAIEHLLTTPSGAKTGASQTSHHAIGTMPLI